MRFIFLFYLLFASLFAKASDQSKLLGYGWRADPQHPYFRLQLDTLNNQPVLGLDIIFPLKGVWNMLLPTYQLRGETNDITVRVKYKSKDVQHFYVTLNSLTNGARVASRDTIMLPASPNWAEVTSQLHLKHADLLSVTLEATGKKDTLGTIQLADFGLYADGKKLSDDVPDAAVAPLFQRSDLLNWTFGNYENLPCMNSTILAVGETVHGTKTMNAVAMDIMKERILKHQCRLVMLELPMESIFYINRYVKNDPRFKFSYISNYIDKFLFDEPTKAFIEWLKQYNATHDNSVSLLGIDANLEWMQSQINLFNFFYTLNDGKKSPEMKKICKAVLQDMGPFSKKNVAALLDSSEVVKSCLQKDELMLVRKGIRLMQWFAKHRIRFGQRDTLMAQFAQFAIDSVFPKETVVTMYAHTGHLNYSQAIGLAHLNYYSAGHYLKEKYGENYRCIDLATYQGATIVSDKDGSYAGGKLATVPQRSIEYQLGQLGVDSVYLPMSKLQSSEALQMRMAGNGSIKVQFIYCYPQTRVDGVLFVRNVEPVIKSERIIKESQEGARPMLNAYKEALDKMKAM
jgi:hypothetical protein